MYLKRFSFAPMFLFLLAITIIGCVPTQAPTPTQPILVDSFFSGSAFLDVNGNGQIDPEDTPVANATFYIEMNGVKAFIETTDEKGYAFIIIPGGVEYPVKVGMEAPTDNTLKLITPSEITVSTSSSVQFLFSSK
jgi:hypothetical protein